MILTTFVSDSDNDEEALQEEICEEDESEKEVATHVRQGTIKSYCFTLSFFLHQFVSIPLILIENIRKTSNLL